MGSRIAVVSLAFVVVGALAAPTPAARERVQARIEAEAHAAALVLRTAFTSPPGGNAAAERDRYCAAHWTAPS